MSPDPLDTLELLPTTAPRQLFVLLHGDGGAAVDMLAQAIRRLQTCVPLRFWRSA